MKNDGGVIRRDKREIYKEIYKEKKIVYLTAARTSMQVAIFSRGSDLDHHKIAERLLEKIN